MQFVNDPRKAKIAFIVVLVFAIIFFLAGGVTGYFYWQKVKAYNNLASDNRKLSDEQRDFNNTLATKTAELQNQKTALEKDKATLEGEKKTLEKQIADSTAANKANQAKITTYKDFFKYLTDVVETHNGLNGWTDAEYQIGRGKAQATGSSSFVADVDWAWNQRDVDQVTRLVKIFRDIIAGIESGLK